jgi:predicted N-acetyltransferase YhbS
MEERAEILVRPASGADRERIRELTTAAYAEYAEVMAPSAWQGLRNAVAGTLAREDPADRIVAELEGRVVGSVMLYPAAADAYAGATIRLPWPEVRLLAVDPAARGRGVARSLMAECVNRAEMSGAARIGIHTSRSMRVAMEMYRRMGFERTPEYDFQPPGAELVEAYTLPIGGPARRPPGAGDASIGEQRSG